MKNITSRPFGILTDCGKIYQFMLEIYERDWRNGVAAPFFEYALASFSYWMDITYSYKNRIWEKNGEIVAFCFYENPITNVFFSLKPGYEELAPEMVTYAAEHMAGGSQLILFGGQRALIEAAKQQGYTCVGEYWDMQLDFDASLNYPLPEGYFFVKLEEVEMEKVGKCCWKGFAHEQNEGPWDHQYDENVYQLAVAPHATPELNVNIADASGEYVCHAGMWWTPENKLAYLEPLCTVPEHRRKGLAAAALSEMYRRMKKLSATHMTGGTGPFYEQIGYQPAVQWTYWKKEGEQNR